MSTPVQAVKGNGGVASEDRPTPLILDLGKHKKKSVKQLRNGKGKLLDEAMDSIEELQRVGTIPHSAQPVFIIVREKQKSTMFPMMGR
jgi:hypothetical protein